MHYELFYENEVLVTRDNMLNLYDKHKIFVVGYGSLLYTKGWAHRNTSRAIKPRHLTECIVKGYERGPFGATKGVHFYGAIPDPTKYLNGTLVRLWKISDWVGLMNTELIAGMFYNYNYRVVDITDQIIGAELPRRAVVHMVVNEPRNRNVADYNEAFPTYYERVWKGVNKERSAPFIEEFLATGGCSPRDFLKFKQIKYYY